MARNRMVNTHFWRDGWIGTLTPPEKLLFLYLITNPAVTVIGVYEIRVAQIALDIGIEESMVERILQKFQASARVTYMEGWMIVHNFERHQSLSGNLIEKARKDLIKRLPDRVSKAYTSPLHTPTAQTSISKSISKSSSKNVEPDLPDSLARHYNENISERAQLTDGAKRKIEARLKSYGFQDLVKAIDQFAADEWQMKHNAHRGMAWFFHTDDRVEQYINMKPRKAESGTVKIR